MLPSTRECLSTGNTYAAPVLYSSSRAHLTWVILANSHAAARWWSPRRVQRTFTKSWTQRERQVSFIPVIVSSSVFVCDRKDKLSCKFSGSHSHRGGTGLWRRRTSLEAATDTEPANTISLDTHTRKEEWVLDTRGWHHVGRTLLLFTFSSLTNCHSFVNTLFVTGCEVALSPMIEEPHWPEKAAGHGDERRRP